MPSTITRFSPEILHSYPLLKDYLFSADADERVKNQVIEASQRPIAHNWMGTRRYVLLYINDIFKEIFYIFAKAISYLLYFIGLKTWSYKLDIQASIALSSVKSAYYKTFGEDLLSPALNVYSADCIDLYLQPRTLKRSLRDKDVRKIINTVRAYLKFDQSEGMCNGESLWFLRHYFKTKDLFTDHREHMKALGQLFSWGSPPEAALLQQLCPKDDFVGLKEKGIESDMSMPKTEKEKSTKIVDEFKKLPVGAYLIYVPNHAMAYICAEEGLGYLFDPNPGTIAIQGSEGFEKLGSHLLHYQKEAKNFWVRIQQVEPKHHV